MAAHQDGSTSHYVSIDELPDDTPAFVPQQRYHLFLIVCALSSLELLSAAAVCASAGQCRGAPAWAVALGLVSAILGAGYLAVVTLYATGVAEAILEPLTLFLFWWWVAGVASVTFLGPFVEVGNGYVASWATLAVALRLLYGSSQTFRSTLDDAWAKIGHSFHFELLATASVVELISALAEGAGWAIAVGSVSLLACAATWVGRSPARQQVCSPAFALCSAGWWMLGVCSLTLTSPFATAGNGFFSTWISLYASVMLIYNSYELPAPSLPGLGGQAGQHASTPAAAPKPHVMPQGNFGSMPLGAPSPIPVPQYSVPARPWPTDNGAAAQQVPVPSPLSGADVAAPSPSAIPRPRALSSTTKGATAEQGALLHAEDEADVIDAEQMSD